MGRSPGDRMSAFKDDLLCAAEHEQADTPDLVLRSAALGFAKATFAVGVLFGAVLGAGLMGLVG